jgi:hypothetical protein
VQSQWSDAQQPTRGIDAALAHRTDHDATPSVAVTHGAYDGLIHRHTHQTHVRSLVRNDDRCAFDISQQVRVLHDVQPSPFAQSRAELSRETCAVRIRHAIQH